jgi:hypothetical protein
VSAGSVTANGNPPIELPPSRDLQIASVVPHSDLYTKRIALPVEKDDQTQRLPLGGRPQVRLSWVAQACAGTAWPATAENWTTLTVARNHCGKGLRMTWMTWTKYWVDFLQRSSWRWRVPLLGIALVITPIQ